MTAHLLQAELSNLLQESKRKNVELRNAAEKSISDLKAIPSTSEAQLAADLVQKPHFCSPFVIACHSHNAKLASIGVVCLQRLVASHSLPVERLKDLLEALRETTSLGVDVQLKILQTLPSLLQCYATELREESLGSTLEICASLQTSKTATVSNTAAATLQQLVVSVFEQVSVEDERPSPTSAITDVQVLGESVSVLPAAHDALRIFNDLCLLVEGEKLQFLRIKSMSPKFVLELIESVLTNNEAIFLRHKEQAQVLRDRLMPLIVKSLSERLSFSFTVRITRILFLLLKRHLTILTIECEMALGLLTLLLEPDGTAPWKRALCMEVLRGLYAEPGLIRTIYSLYDEQKERKNIVRDQMAALVRLASEKPSLIGISHQSTLPYGQGPPKDISDEQATMEAAGVAGVIGSAVTTADSKGAGISSEWSTVRTPCIDLLDKSDGPSLPDTYIYSLVLNCINSFAEGLARFILPLTVPLEGRGKRRHRIATPTERDGSPIPENGALQRTDSATTSVPSSSRKSQVPLNPLELDSHPQFDGIKTSAAMIDSCWPAILATCSTFLYAALDAEFYHNLVRSFQKITHVAGLLRLTTPRDAFLTTLAKAAVPAEALNVSTPAPTTPAPDGRQSSLIDRKLLTVESPTIDSPTQSTAAPRPSFEEGSSSLSTRNLLCLRALLNLGIALGPTMEQAAWSIILETLQQADLVINISLRLASRKISQPNQDGERATGSEPTVPKVNLGGEIVAVQTASTKMFESTTEYPAPAFLGILNALLKLAGSFDNQAINSTVNHQVASPRSPQIPRRPGRMHQSARSISIAFTKSRFQDDELKFVLEKTKEVALVNLTRVTRADPEESGWRSLVEFLMDVIKASEIDSAIRERAAVVLDELVFESIKSVNSEELSLRKDVQKRSLTALRNQVRVLYERDAQSDTATRIADFEVHDLALETLKSTLDQCGESLIAGWNLVFEVICSVFNESRTENAIEKNGTSSIQADQAEEFVSTKAPKLVRTAFSSLQLVGSDFLGLLPSPCLLEVVNSLFLFGSQKDDFNISLSTTTFFWNLSDFLQGRIGDFSLGDRTEVTFSEKTLTEMAKLPDGETSMDALWLLLLLRVVKLTVDDRSDVRNGAIHTLLRIFDAYGGKLSAEAWHLCLNMVLFIMVEANQRCFPRLDGSKESRDVSRVRGWSETTVMMTKGFANLFANYLGVIVSHSSFPTSWKRLLSFFYSVQQTSLDCSTAVFSGLAEILSRVETIDNIGEAAVEVAWNLWSDGNPAKRKWPADMEDQNQDSSMAYLRAFHEIYRLMTPNLTEDQIHLVLKNLRTCVWESAHSRYASDIDQPSATQKLVLDCVRAICVDIEASQSAILICLAEFVDCPISKRPPDQESRRPSYVAFSKSSMEDLDWCITDHGIKIDVFATGALGVAIKHFATVINSKYKWQGKDKEPSLWRKATTAALKIIEVAIPYVESADRDPATLKHLWEHIVSVAKGIISADLSKAIPSTPIQPDQAFDITSFQHLHTLIIPSLGSPTVLDSARRSYTSALFTASLIHAPHRLDMPNLEDEPLQNLYKPRMGRTYDPQPTPRRELAYVLIDTLCALVSARDDPSQAHIALARAAAPYVILRSALPLKAYIADQPLRGLMPQPTSQRRELLYLLKKLVELESEPSAFPEREGILGGTGKGTKRRKHLAWVFPLVQRAVKVAGRDTNGEVLGGLGEVLEVIGGEGGGDE